MFKQVESGDKEFVRLIYHRDNNAEASTFIYNIYNKYELTFGRDATLKTFGTSSNVHHNMTTSDLEEKYTTALSSILQSSPQLSTQAVTPPPIPKSVYYGKSPIGQKNKQKSYAEVITPPKSTTTPSYISIKNQLNELTNKTNTIEQTLTESPVIGNNQNNVEKIKNDIETSIMEKVELTITKKMKQFDDNLDSAIQEVKQQQEQKIASLQSLIVTTSQKNIALAQQHAKELEERTIIRENSNTNMIIKQMQKMLEQKPMDPVNVPTNAPVRAVENNSCHGVTT